MKQGSNVGLILRLQGGLFALKFLKKVLNYGII